MGRSRTGRQGIDSVSDLNSSGDEGDTVRLALGLKDPNRPVKLLIAQIKRDPRAQPRVKLDMATVEEYAQDMRQGDQFPPGVVFFDGTEYWLAAGWTRTAAAESIGRAEYEYIKRDGTLRDAILFSLGENSAHGLRRTNEDKRRAVQTMLDDPEWGGLGSREIGQFCKVSHTFVDNFRRSLATVASEGEYEKKTSETRTGMDGREYNVSRIQKKAEKRAGKAPPKPIRSFVPDDDPLPAEEPVTDSDQLDGMRPATATGRFGPAASVAAKATVEEPEYSLVGPDWMSSQSRRLLVGLMDLCALKDSTLEDEFAALPDSVAEKIARYLSAVGPRMGKWEGWLE